MSTQIVEHIVLFRVKPESDPTKTDSMISALNSLAALDQVLHLTAGPIHHNRSPSSAFTHILHSRHSSKDDLNSYSGHPTHISTVANFVRPICDDVMAVDWVGLTGRVVPRPGSAMRVTLLKLKEGLGENERTDVSGAIGGVKEYFPSIDDISFGENFSPARAKGFSIGSIAIFPSLRELEALDSNSEVANSRKDKVRHLLESVIVLDYVIRQLHNASL